MTVIFMSALLLLLKLYYRQLANSFWNQMGILGSRVLYGVGGVGWSPGYIASLEKPHHVVAGFGVYMLSLIHI